MYSYIYIAAAQAHGLVSAICDADEVSACIDMYIYIDIYRESDRQRDG